jgi:4-hydroxybenzoate polyprenyltransferase
LFWFLAASFCNGIVIEIGRKIRAPADEENGVQTYSFLWGRSVAVTAWLGMMLATAACATLAARRIGFTLPVAAGTAMIFLLGLVTGTNFLRSPRPGNGKRFELLAGVWTLVLYLSLGAIPLTWRLIFHR